MNIGLAFFLGNMTLFSSLLLGLIFLDYHKKSNVHKAIWFILLVLSGIIVLTFLLSHFGMSLMYFIPLISAIPFIMAFAFKAKKNKMKDEL